MIAFLADHPDQFGYLIGAVLKIGIHGYNHVTCGSFKPGLQRCRLPVVPAKAHSPDAVVVS